jgi:hypothetical protein
VVLKYQLHISDSRRNDFVPLQLHAQWRCEAHQTSFLMTYAPNAACRLTDGDTSANTPAVLEDLQLAVNISPSSVTNIMSKPTATFVGDTSSLFWKITDALSLADTEPRKVLARCQISGSPTVPQPVHLRWKIKGRSIAPIAIAVRGDHTVGELIRTCTAGKFFASP